MTAVGEGSEDAKLFGLIIIFYPRSSNIFQGHKLYQTFCSQFLKYVWWILSSTRVAARSSFRQEYIFLFISRYGSPPTNSVRSSIEVPEGTRRDSIRWKRALLAPVSHGRHSSYHSLYITSEFSLAFWSCPRLSQRQDKFSLRGRRRRGGKWKKKQRSKRLSVREGDLLLSSQYSAVVLTLSLPLYGLPRRLG